jgi:hypothetical protein
VQNKKRSGISVLPGSFENYGEEMTRTESTNKSMRKKEIRPGMFEWSWNQKYSCGHVCAVTVIRKNKPSQERLNAEQVVCPKCEVEENET